MYYEPYTSYLLYFYISLCKHIHNTHTHTYGINEVTTFREQINLMIPLDNQLLVADYGTH